MQIDVGKENVIKLSEAAKLFPTGLGAKKSVHVNTVRRWIRYGARGVKLESVAVGGMLLTSREAVERFMRRLNPSSQTAADVPHPDANKAGELLAAAGC